MVSVVDIAHVAFAHADLAKVEPFYRDFGLEVAHRATDRIYFRGAGSRPYVYVAHQSSQPRLLAISLQASSMEDLHEASDFPGASAIEPIDGPAGGKRVSLSSPEGIPFELVWGLEETAPLTMRPPLAVNHAHQKTRKGTFQRAAFEPAAILRLGHVALTTTNFALSAQWLTDCLGMRASDILYDGDPSNSLGGFFNCGGAESWTDHHTIALFPGKDAGVHHCSFEVQDVDAQFLGCKYLESQGWRHLWGIGRHILGSQIFDYWFDPSGNVVEHFTDGDLVDGSHATGFHQVSDDSLAQWGPPMSVPDFLDKVPSN